MSRQNLDSQHHSALQDPSYTAMRASNQGPLLRQMGNAEVINKSELYFTPNQIARMQGPGALLLAWQEAPGSFSEGEWNSGDVQDQRGQTQVPPRASTETKPSNGKAKARIQALADDDAPEEKAPLSLQKEVQLKNYRVQTDIAHHTFATLSANIGELINMAYAYDERILESGGEVKQLRAQSVISKVSECFTALNADIEGLLGHQEHPTDGDGQQHNG